VVATVAAVHVRRVYVGGGKTGMRHPNARPRVRLAVAEAGDQGGRPLLLVHGFTGAKEDFTDFLDPLAARGWHAVAPDLRGHGQSEHPPGEEAYSEAMFVSDLVALVDALGWQRFALVGHSMGGALAQRIAIEHPRRVSALVLVSTFHGPLDIDPELVAFGVALAHQGGMAAVAAAQAARRDADPVAAAAYQRMTEARPHHAERLERRFLACSRDMWVAMVQRFGAWPDTLDQLRRLSVPTLVVVGEQDDTMGAHCHRLAATIPGARLEVLTGIRHSPQLETPDEWWPIVADFLDEVAAAGA